MTSKENFTHIPVMLNEVITGLDIKSNGTYLDLTLGRAGHSSEILKRLTTGTLIGVDQDEEALIASKSKLEKIGSNFHLVRNNFVNINQILKELKIQKVDGILMDLGVSSPQFDDITRGFSYREDAFLDMRMDQRQSLTAYQIVNTYPLSELCKIFREYGDETYAYQISKNIINTREKAPIKTTLQLVELVKKSKPAKVLAKQGHPAKQAFQALRIAVNDEINVLTSAIKDAATHLKSGGRLAIITFHSGEDRIVKNYFRSLTVQEGNRSDLPMEREEIKFRLVNKSPLIPTKEEQQLNHRSVSAKLRILEKI